MESTGSGWCPRHVQSPSPVATKQRSTMMEKTLYERLGGVFAIAAVVDRFSDEVVKNQVAGQGSDNPRLREWHTQKLARLPGLKFMRTLWVCHVAGGPFEYVGTVPGHDQ